MEAHIHEWINLLIRWIHFIVGVAWIGASFYFNWLENRLNREPPQEEGIAGHLWAVHGGGFYYLKKFKRGPDKLPAELHWFKWEAYTTWLSGITLLAVIYYFNARLFLIDVSVADLPPAKAIVLGVIAVIGSWFAYDGMCRSPLRHSPILLSVSVFFYFSILALLLSEVFSGRAAYIHVGAAIGTVMVGNVFFVIIPAQKEMVSALQQNRQPDPSFGANGLLRSRHNNYLTLPVLFIMVSSHFPSTYGHHWNWLVLVMLSLIAVAVRHYFNVRHIMKSLWWILPAAFIAMAGAMWFTAPAQPAHTDKRVTTREIVPIVEQRCSGCHSLSPTQPGFAVAPQGLAFDGEREMERYRDRIYTATVVTKTMPLGNLTGITEEERQQIAQWFSGFTNTPSVTTKDH